MSSCTEILDWDIIIVGTGAAGLTAALSAATTSSPRPSPRILLIDKAPEAWAGGNGYFTAAAYRTQHNGLPDLLPLVSNVDEEIRDKIDLPPYTHENFTDDLKRVTGGRSDETLGRYLVGESLETVKWLKEVGGVDWWLSFRRQAYQVDGRWVFWGGLHLTCPEGGKGLIKALVKSVRDVGCTISFETSAKKILVGQDGKVEGLEIERNGKAFQLRTKSLILAAGGFEASPELRKMWMGPAWEMAHTRGTPYNTGEMLKSAIELGAKRVGDFSPTGCHSVAWDADSPKTGGDREKTNEFTKSGYPLGLMLNAEGRRFVDEGIDLRNYTYAKFGRAILEEPEGIAFQVWDDDGQQLLRTEEYRDEIVRKIKADSIEELARKLSDDGLRNPGEFVQTINEYNSAVAAHRKEHPNIKFNPAVKDGLSTQSSSTQLSLAKSNWALPITKPPFVAVKVTTGITFTFGGLSINPENAAVLREDGCEIEGLHCCGEMVGGLFYGNYPGGSGLTAGGVFGRRAGRAAATRAKQAPGLHNA
ncbi:Fumarate reductase flavoprotein subunit [Pseudocercospora fuligena]|uniref:Fumarate reductase flavoprotein subunit n=1 Tax=Pseudocercospora fuligena TaxID=685502 RepID=A0A8H6R8N9_9PEZI|nr:Fumarate reductase flavoprotein subunit [Pseudocercospora fuligena]